MPELSELQRLELLLLEVLRELREERQTQRQILAALERIQEALGAPSLYPASTGAVISVS